MFIKGDSLSDKDFFIGSQGELCIKRQGYTLIIFIAEINAYTNRITSILKEISKNEHRYDVFTIDTYKFNLQYTPYIALFHNGCFLAELQSPSNEYGIKMFFDNYIK